MRVNQGIQLGHICACILRDAGEVGSGSCDGSCLPMTGPGRREETMRLTNSVNLNSMDPVFIEFENWQFTVYGFKIFEK
jgi:hypothetical protein